ncbi:hypothetical protein [Tabrizicola sp.]|uniref:hypothetical protein n=1 Tax=Tabrizicola sp. TaxID=2005166 RepID=UPI001A5165D7|nr:hypothetical protein [Tabrizicola sp.]MBL9063701.1 hypothetical protein [Tabrizicola sp.]
MWLLIPNAVLALWIAHLFGWSSMWGIGLHILVSVALLFFGLLLLLSVGDLLVHLRRLFSREE